MFYSCFLSDSLCAEEHVRDLAIELDGFPHALASVGAYLKNSTISCRDYLKLYQLQWHKHVREDLPHANPTYVAWEITMKEIARKNTNAEYIANYWSILSNGDIWASLLKHAGHGTRLGRIGRDLPVFYEAMRVLCEYGLAEVGTDQINGRTHGLRGYCMHKCVHQWVFSVNSRMPCFGRRADKILQCVVKYSSRNQGSIEDFYQILPHADRCLQLIRRKVMGQKDNLTLIYVRLYLELSEYYEAISELAMGKSGHSASTDEDALSPGARFLKRFGPIAQQFFAEGHSSRLDYLGVTYTEKRHLLKVEELSLLILEMHDALPSDDCAKVKIRFQVHFRLMFVYRRKGKFFRYLKSQFIAMRHYCQATDQRWYGNFRFLILIILLFLIHFFTMWNFYYWLTVVVSITYRIYVAFLSESGLDGPISVALTIGIWIAWICMIRRVAARWKLFVPWAGLIIASGMEDGWPIRLLNDLFTQITLAVPILLYEGLG